MHFRDEARSEGIIYVGMNHQGNPYAKLSELGSNELASSLALRSDRSCT